MSGPLLPQPLLTPHRDKLLVVTEQWQNFNPENVLQNATRSNSTRSETVRRNAEERRDKILTSVHDLEKRLNTARWAPGTDQWKAAQTLVEHADYQKALDKLESLIVARMFELGRMNMSRTGE